MTIGVTTNISPAHIQKAAKNKTVILVLGIWSTSETSIPEDIQKISSISELEEVFGVDTSSISEAQAEEWTDIDNNLELKTMLELYNLNNLYFGLVKQTDTLKFDDIKSAFDKHLTSLVQTIDDATDIIIAIPYFNISGTPATSDTYKSYIHVVDALRVQAKDLFGKYKCIVTYDEAANITTGDGKLYLTAQEYIQCGSKTTPRIQAQNAIGCICGTWKYEDNTFIKLCPGSLHAACVYALNDIEYNGFPARSLLNAKPNSTYDLCAISDDGWYHARKVYNKNITLGSGAVGAEDLAELGFATLCHISKSKIRYYGLMPTIGISSEDETNKFDNRVRLLYHICNWAQNQFADYIGEPLTKAQQNGIKYAFKSHLDEMRDAGALVGDGYIEFISEPEDLTEGYIIMDIRATTSSPIKNIIFDIRYTNEGYIVEV